MLRRYALPEMRQLWPEDESEKYNYWLKVEIAVAEARNRLGELPREGFLAIRDHAKVNVRRIEELDGIYEHDMIAFIETIQESMEEVGVGKWKNEFHKKLTSYNVEDPAMVLMLRRACELNLNELNKLVSALQSKALEYRDTIMIARTHGKYGEPSVFGHMLLTHSEEIKRCRDRMEGDLRISLSEGNISGAVGVYGGIDPSIERQALRILGLKPAVAENQILQRDRHAEFISHLSIAAGAISRIAFTFWLMMRDDTGELEEPRKAQQRGSSAMAHKKNSILCERILGLKDVIHVYALLAKLNMTNPEFRWIAHSSVERHIFPGVTALTHYIANKMTFIVENLLVFPENMKFNLSRSYETWASQPVRNALMDAGMSYREAYLLLQNTSFEAFKDQRSLKDILIGLGIGDKAPVGILGWPKFNACFNLKRYIQEGVDYIFRRSLGK